MHRSSRQVVEAGRLLGVEVHPREFPASTRTAAEAALAIGVDLGQIVKSLVFCVGVEDGDSEAVVALVSGDNRLDEQKLAAEAGTPAAWRADADSARDATGYPVGGVPPFGHRVPLRIFLDEDLLGYEVLWAAAGTPHCNFPITPTDLVRATAGRVCDIASRR